MTRNPSLAVSLLAASTTQDESHTAKRSKEIKEAAQERSPVRLFLEDVVLLMRNLRLSPYIVLPRRKVPKLPGVTANKLRTGYGWAVVFFLSFLEIPLLIAALPAAVLLPGWAFAAVAALSSAVIYSLAWTTWGTLVVESGVEGVDKSRFEGEKWFYLNGITTSHASLRQDVDSLSATFGRPVTGVHNRSFGVPFDLIECLIQRSFSYHTSDVRVATESISMALEDPSIDKIVVIAHSQGGLILSLVLDRLYTILPAGLFAKMEVFTLGSAANFFHNPLVKHLSPNALDLPDGIRGMTKAATDPPKLISTAEDDDAAGAVMTAREEPRPEIPNRLIHTIEHYVNGWDLVPRWGVLYHILLGNGSDYSGRVFVHQNASGHLFEDHYLSVMFPLEDLGRIKAGDPHTFLNHKVHMDKKKNGDTESKWWGVFQALTARMGNDDDQESQDGEPGETESWRNGQASRLEFDRAPRVKDISKLWRYMDGGKVEELRSHPVEA